MAVAASLDLVLSAKTDKLDSGLDEALKELGEFKGKVQAFTAREQFDLATGNMKNLSSATMRYADSLNKTGASAAAAFSPGKLIGWLVTFESIKKAIELVRSEAEKGFFDAQTTAELQQIGSSFNELKGKAATLFAEIGIFFKPLIGMAEQFGGAILDGITFALDKWTEFAGSFRDVLRGEKGPPKVVGLSDSARAEIQSGALERFKEERERKANEISPAVAILEGLKSPAEQIADKTRVLTEEFRKGAIDSLAYQKGMAALREQWAESQKVTNELTDAERERISTVKRLYEETRTPLEKFNAEFQKLQSLIASQSIDTDTYNRSLAKLRQEFMDSDPAIAKFRERMEQLRDRAQQIRENNRTPEERFNEGIREVQDLLAAGVLGAGDAQRQIESLLREQQERRGTAKAELAEVGSSGFASLIANPAGQNAMMEERKIAMESQRILREMLFNMRKLAEDGAVVLQGAPG